MTLFKIICVSAFVLALAWGGKLIRLKWNGDDTPASDTFSMAKGILQICVFGPFVVIGWIFGLRSKPEPKYNARWANRRERRALMNGKHKGLTVTGHPEHRISRKLSFQHFLVSGKSGSGKSTVITRTNTLLLDDCLIVVIDPVGKNFQDTAGYKAQQGFRVLALNFLNPDYSLRWNPLDEVTDEASAAEFAHRLVVAAFGENPTGDKFWISKAKTVLTILISALIRCEKKFRNLANLVHLVDAVGNDGKALEGFMIRYASERMFHKWIGLISKDSKLLTNIMATVEEAVAFDERVLAITASSTLNLKTIRKEKTFLSIMAQEESFSGALSSFFALFFSSLFKALSRMPEPGEMDTFLLLDEFPVIARKVGAEAFSQYISVLRKRNCSITLMCQNPRSQFGQTLGNHVTEDIITNTASKLNFAPNTTDLANELSTICGRTTIKHEGGRDEVVPLLTPEQALSSSDAYLFLDGTKIRQQKTYPHYKHRPYTDWMAAPPVELPYTDSKAKIPLLDLAALNQGLNNKS